MDTSAITEMVRVEFQLTKKVHPTPEDAVLFLLTEVGEVAELLLSRRSWVRNHPEDKEEFSSERLAEELGDVIYMAIVTGIESNVDAVQALENKLKEHIVLSMRGNPDDRSPAVSQMQES